MSHYHLCFRRTMLSVSAIVLLFSSLWLHAEPEQAVAQLFVRGQAQLLVPPDQVSIVLGVASEAKRSRKAMDSNTAIMRRVIDALHSLGLSKHEYKTQNFRVEPIWSVRPKGADKYWRSSIVSYRVRNNLRITTSSLELVGDIIAAATEAGANQVNSMSFSLADERQYRQQAITQAMNNAREDADTLAAASGDRIARTLSLTLDNTSASRFRAEAASKARFTSALADSVAPPPISSGDISVSASVSVTYELESP